MTCGRMVGRAQECGRVLLAAAHASALQATRLLRDDVVHKRHHHFAALRQLGGGGVQLGLHEHGLGERGVQGGSQEVAHVLRGRARGEGEGLSGAWGLRAARRLLHTPPPSMQPAAHCGSGGPCLRARACRRNLLSSESAVSAADSPPAGWRTRTRACQRAWQQRQRALQLRPQAAPSSRPLRVVQRGGLVPCSSRQAPPTACGWYWCWCWCWRGGVQAARPVQARARMCPSARAGTRQAAGGRRPESAWCQGAGNACKWLYTSLRNAARNP